MRQQAITSTKNVHQLIEADWQMYASVNQAIIGSDNGLPPDRRQAIIRNKAGILLIGPSTMNFSEIIIKIHNFQFKKLQLKMLSGNWQPFCLSLSVLS